MKNTSLVIAGLSGLIACAGCRDLPGMPYEPARAEAEIREMEQGWAQVAVTGDPAVLDHILADDFVGVSPEGVQYTKRELIEDTKAHPMGFASIALDDMKVRFIGNVAVAQGRETFTRRDGERGRFVWTDVLERRGRRWVIIAAQDVVASAGERPPGGTLFSGASPAPAATPAVREIERTRSEYVAAWLAGNADQLAGLYAEDALVLYPDQPPVSGRRAIGDYFKGFFEEFDRAQFELRSVEIVVTGSWAYDRGTYRWKGTPRKGGGPVEDSGKYLVILVPQPDGRWRVARDMDNSDRAAAQATRGTP
jgi:uncharacterized protein (TIGR02246 family)